MNKQTDIAQEQGRLRGLKHFFAMALVVCAAFWVMTALCFALLDVACRLAWVPHHSSLHVRWDRFFYQPFYVIGLYGDWWKMLLKSVRVMHIRLFLLTPFIVPLGMFFGVAVYLAKKQYSFRLWYSLTHHFAKWKDICLMGLNQGTLMVLGRFGSTLLSVKPKESVLCVGEMGTGKTSSVAIPSILHSDTACVLAVDMTGVLPKYTVGHRSELGPVFYYNWDLLDDAKKGVYYPRWNPLAEANFPKQVQEWDAYLQRIASYLIDAGEAEDDDYWLFLGHGFMTALLEYWTAKTRQARANDYFLSKLVAGQHLNKDDKDVLLSFYIQMPEVYVQEAIKKLENGGLNQDNYVPIGSWAGVPEQWTGKEACFASLTDWAFANYLGSVDERSKDWQGWLRSLMCEAALFGYGKGLIERVQTLLGLSARQRQLVFAYTLRPLEIFTNQAIRERTDGNDMNLDDIRGVYDKQLQRFVPVTVYALATTQASKIMNQMFLDEALWRNLQHQEDDERLPVMMVLDDVGHNLRLRNMVKLLESGRQQQMSVLLLCNSLSLVERRYSRAEVECMVINTNYKIIKATDNQKVGFELDKLASFATRSVQLPKLQAKIAKRGRKYFADAVYFHHLANVFKTRKNVHISTQGYQIVLAEGYYNRPILADNIFVSEDKNFSHLAVLDGDYALSTEKVAEKSDFLLHTPKISEIFNDKDLGVDDEVELEQYMNAVFMENAMKQPESQEPRYSKPVMKKDGEIKRNIQENKPEVAESSTDWWLAEDAFRVDEKEQDNPFNRKKEL